MGSFNYHKVYSRNYTDPFAAIACTLLLILVIGFIVVYQLRQQAICEAKGGMYLRNDFKHVCVKMVREVDMTT